LTTFRSAFATFIVVLCAMTSAHATCDDTTKLTELACKRLIDTWSLGGDDLYVPFHTFHLPYAYSDEAIDSLRSETWGLGYGRSRYNDYGNWDGLYGMIFLDSHSKPQPIFGYGHEWMWGPRERLHAGLGYTIFVTARADINSYTPIPAILPITSINYDKVSVNAAFLPGGMGFGNILFLWSRFGF
jgi:palmitoyl transferase